MEKQEWIWNPKIKGSGMITCIPQRGRCANNCPDCFFQSGRSYLEPLWDNLPHVPTVEQVDGRVVKMNDGNDSNHERELVEKTANGYKHAFFNTASPMDLEKYSRPVVLTINPGTMVDISYYKLDKIPPNLMFVRARVNTWNIVMVSEAVKYYTDKGVRVVLTFMAYYNEALPREHHEFYEWRKRVVNSYWVLKPYIKATLIERFVENDYVYTCGWKGTAECKLCGNCLREYFRTVEEMKENNAKTKE